MADINLLRPVIEEKRKGAKTKARLGFYITFAIVLFVLVTGAIFGARFSLSGKNKQLDNEISSLENQLGETREIEEKIREFNTIVNQIKGLEKDKVLWSEIYKTIAGDTPSEIKLTKVSLTTSTGKGVTATAEASKLKITGETLSRRAVALFQDKLEKSGGDFFKIDIISSKKTEETGTEGQVKSETIDFEISISLKNS